jgi:hypothetical protein
MQPLAKAGEAIESERRPAATTMHFMLISCLGERNDLSVTYAYAPLASAGDTGQALTHLESSAVNALHKIYRGWNREFITRLYD